MTIGICLLEAAVLASMPCMSCHVPRSIYRSASGGYERAMPYVNLPLLLSPRRAAVSSAALQALSSYPVFGQTCQNWP